MKRALPRVLLVALGVVLGAGGMVWFFLAERTYTFTFTAEELREHLTQKLPLKKEYLNRFTVVFENPRVTLEDNSDHIHFGIDVRLEGVKFKVKGIGLKTPSFTGAGDLLTRVGYDPDDGTFVLTDSELLDLQVPGLPTGLEKRFVAFANASLLEYLVSIPFYKLRSQDVKTSTARLVLKQVDVRDGKLHVTIGVGRLNRKDEG